ncbi:MULTISPECIES: response regulator [unclassified Roseateles]|uniref:response regulator n=1 Tax=unclassified Roseateles TaxID=2626991 RepID=UPI0006FE2BD6|nr:MULTISPECIES: response regulator [unclassified Roseateles]KQW43243.1 hypothetical protein ASC81_15685 [Pelomonas sp. Root405]KRA70981.1 hypothetical protein ASD88_14210 [Pelomonas sp. Root662]
MATSSTQPSGGLRIFVVEDNEDTRNILSQLLQVMGHQVSSAGTIRQAVQDLRHTDVDVIISDLGLPDGEGYELLGQLSPSHPVYAIAMSGYGTLDDRERSAAVGFRHHLVKPMDIDKLESVLAEAAAERSLPRH